MHEVDGSDGGGQLLRSALSLSALSGRPVRVENVRGSRPDPGLKAQHAAAVEAAARVANADVQGAEIGSETVSFEPGDVSGGEYDVDVGTAGSITLVFETVLPLALATDAPIRLHATGGTDVTWSPPLDFLARVKLPLLRSFGLVASLDRERRGFYPVGGGAATLTLGSSSLDSIELPAAPEIDGVRVLSTAANDLREPSVAERMASSVTKAVEEPEPGGGPEIPVSETVVRYADADCPGAVVVLAAETEIEGRRTPVAGFDAIGERGTPSEEVAETVTAAFAEYLDGPAAVDRHLADQLLLPLAVAGGELRIPDLTDHVETSRELLAGFGFDVDCERRDDGALLRSSGVPR